MNWMKREPANYPRTLFHRQQRSKLSLTHKAMRALTEAVAKVVEDHRCRGIPLAVWHNGRAVSIPAEEACTLRETTHTNRSKAHG